MSMRPQGPKLLKRIILMGLLVFACDPKGEDPIPPPSAGQLASAAPNAVGGLAAPLAEANPLEGLAGAPSTLEPSPDPNSETGPQSSEDSGGAPL